MLIIKNYQFVNVICLGLKLKTFQFILVIVYVVLKSLKHPCVGYLLIFMRMSIILSVTCVSLIYYFNCIHFHEYLEFVFVFCCFDYSFNKLILFKTRTHYYSHASHVCMGNDVHSMYRGHNQ